MGPMKHYYGEEIRRWQFQNMQGVTHYEVSELFGNAYLQVQTGKIAADKRNIFDETEFHLTEENEMTDNQMS